jgi:hypothetical protein
LPKERPEKKDRGTQEHIYDELENYTVNEAVFRGIDQAQSVRDQVRHSSDHECGKVGAFAGMPAQVGNAQCVIRVMAPKSAAPQIVAFLMARHLDLAMLKAPIVQPQSYLTNSGIVNGPALASLGWAARVSQFRLGGKPTVFWTEKWGTQEGGKAFGRPLPEKVVFVGQRVLIGAQIIRETVKGNVNVPE